MPTIERNAIVPYTDKEMFDMVSDIESYPSFLPWCSGAVVHSRENNVVEASLTVASMGIEKTFTTRNTETPHSHILLELLDGPFEKLEGSWEFKSLGAEGSKVSLVLDYVYKGGWAHIAFGSVFTHVAGELVDAFVKRANDVLGEARV